MTGFRPRGRRGIYTAAATAFTTGALALLAAAMTAPQPPPAPPPSARTAPVQERQSPQPHNAALPRSEPVAISSPRIGLRTQVERVTRAADGSIALPADPDHAGWYTGSVTPGERGNAIAVGHVDSGAGPAAFYALGALRKGFPLTVSRRDGSAARFTVTGMEVWAKNAFPSRHVYGPTTTATLTLITCADWDSTSRTYRSNLVITARLIPS
ncbi:sortase domain-bontaining protein [Streptomyces sp. NPDC012825]|uniref:sortase domain-containing protein n=1 Tax=Streptomyces sp. NPDC012825 TaxID=3364851 RepID=UPI00368378EF